jgi:predicted nuclease of predicted toxin-antitoxin system
MIRAPAALCPVIRFLIDENLPATLAASLTVPCMHATDLGGQPTDAALWEHAARDGWVILTKDADFFDRLTLQGPPPKVVWVRTGNLRRTALEDQLAANLPFILRLLTEADLVEVHPDRIETFKF